MKCDFCSAPDPAWKYPAESFVVKHVVTTKNNLTLNSIEEWYACEACYMLVEANEREILAKNSVYVLVKRCNDQRVVDRLVMEVTHLHDAFFEHRKGAAERL